MVKVFQLTIVCVVVCQLSATYWTAEFDSHKARSSRVKRQAFDAIEIKRLEITTSVVARFSDTEVISEVENADIESQEIVFQTQLPKKAFISNFSMVIDGIEYPGIVKEKAIAEEEYREAKKKGTSAGLVQTQQRETQWFKVSVNVESFHSVIFKLRYQQLLERKLGRYEQVVFADPGMAVGFFSVKVFITEPTGIDDLDAPDAYTGTSNTSPQDNDFVKTIRKSKTQAYINYFKSNYNPSKDSSSRRFVVRYDVERPNEAGDVWRHNGYFVHFIAPSLVSLPKRVVFVVDTSGSMAWGRKMDQTKEALESILGQLNTGDTFNFVTFSSAATKWKSSFVGKNRVQSAITFSKRMRASGGTNLNDAVLKAIGLLDSASMEDEVYGTSLIILLTDGDPTVGETNGETIKQNIKSRNENRYPIFTLGFGSDVKQDLLKQIAFENQGKSKKIYAESDAAEQLRDFFDEVANPLLMNLTVSYNGEVYDVTEKIVPIYFKGSEVMVIGRYTDENFVATVEGGGFDGEFVRTVTSKKFDDEYKYSVPENVGDNFNDFFERMWAYMTVSQLMKREFVESESETKEALNKRILELSLKYKFVTPLTAMIAKKPSGQDEEVTKISEEKPVETRPFTPVIMRQRLNAYSGPIGRTHHQQASQMMSLAHRHSPPQLNIQRSMPRFSNYARSGSRRVQSSIFVPQSHDHTYIAGPRSSSRKQNSRAGKRRKNKKHNRKSHKRIKTTTTTTTTTTAPTTTTTPTPFTTTTPSPLGPVPDPDQFLTNCQHDVNVTTQTTIGTEGAYRPNERCIWRISNPYYPMTDLKLTFQEFDLEDNSQCQLDRLVVYSDFSTSERLNFKTFCGYEGVTNSTMTASKNFVVILQSDGQVQGGGFKASLDIHEET